MAKAWTFRQLGGDRRELTLAGEAAPHGRPRKQPVVSDGIKLRRQRVFYPASESPPTTHIFGVEWLDWTLKGRFADRYLGKGGTKRVIVDWHNFVADQQPVSVSWGDIVTCYGYVDAFTPGRESETECSYEITVIVDREASRARSTASVKVADGPRSICEALQRELNDGAGAIPNKPSAGGMKWSFLDTLDDLVQLANVPSSLLVSISKEFDTFASGTIDQLEKLKAGAVQMRTATLQMRRTFETTRDDAVLLTRTSDDDVQWYAAKAAIDVSVLRMLALLDELDRQAEIAMRGTFISTYVARGGDTWESISTLVYGGPEGAGRLRSANGVRYGELPVGGREYQVPQES